MMRELLTPVRRRAGFPAVRLLVLLAALAGLFAMHGMSDHGAMQHGAPGAHEASMASAPADLLAHVAEGHLDVHGAVMAPMDTVPAVVRDAAAAGGGAVDTGLHAAMTLCLAILAAAAVLALRRPRTWSSPLTLAPLALMTLVAPSLARSPDPPDLHVLSIQRC